MRKSGLIAAISMVLSILVAPQSSAVDTELPILVGGTVSPSSIAPGGTINVNFQITDDEGCCTWAAFWVYDSAGTNVGSANASRSSGTPTNGTYAASLAINSSLTSGTYTVKAQATDLATRYTHLVPLGSFSIVSDTELPVLVGGSVSPSSITRGGSINVSFQITDDVGCCTWAAFWVYNSAGTNVGSANASRTSGSPTNGTYSASLAIDSSLTSGTYTVKAQATDLATRYTHLVPLGSFSIAAPTPTASPSPTPSASPKASQSPTPTSSPSATPTPTTSPTLNPTNSTNFEILQKSFGGMVTSNSKFTLANSPYSINKTIEIPKGVEVQIEAGVEINASVDTLFKVNGKLVASGTQSNRIKFNGMPKTFFSNSGSDVTGLIDINYAIFNGGGALMPPSGGAGRAPFNLKNSEVYDLSNYTYIWYPDKSVTIERNYFKNSAGFSIGFDARNTKVGGVKSVQVINNLFDGESNSGYWVEVWASYGSSVLVTGNSFINGRYNALQIRKSTKDGAYMSAPRNYWGTTDLNVIASMVTDSNDSIDYKSKIDISNPLTEPDANTPTVQQLSTAVNKKPVEKTSVAQDESGEEIEAEIEEFSGSISYTYNDLSKKYTLKIKSNLENEPITIRATKKGSRAYVFRTTTGSLGSKNLVTSTRLKGYTVSLIYEAETLFTLKI